MNYHAGIFKVFYSDRSPSNSLTNSNLQSEFQQWILQLALTGTGMLWCFVVFQASCIRENLCIHNRLMLWATMNFQILLKCTNFDWWEYGKRIVAQNAGSQVAGRRH